MGTTDKIASIKDASGYDALRVETRHVDRFGGASILLTAGALPCIFSAHLTPAQARELARELLVRSIALEDAARAAEQPQPLPDRLQRDADAVIAAAYDIAAAHDGTPRPADPAAAARVAVAGGAA